MTEKEINNYIDKNFDENHNGKHFLLMLFKTEIDLGISNNPNRWECIRTRYFTHGTQAQAGAGLGQEIPQQNGKYNGHIGEEAVGEQQRAQLHLAGQRVQLGNQAGAVGTEGL